MVKVKTSAALASEIAKGSSIEVDEGNYYLNSVKIGNGLKLTPFDDDNPPIIFMAAKHPSNPMLNGSRLKDISLEGIILDGNFSNQPGAIRGRSSLILCYLEDCSHIHMEGCVTRNSAVDALKIRRCDDIEVKNNEAYKLGHEFVYALNNCIGLTIEGNTVNTCTNSAFRLSGGCTGFDIYDNTIYTGPDNPSTGPGGEIDKGSIAEGEIHHNTFRNLLGAGIWAIGNGGSCKNVSIHHNTFDNVGKYAKDNGYSNGCFTGAGFDGLVFENNTIVNVPNVVLMNEWDYSKYLAKTKYGWIFRNNIVKNAMVGFRIDNSRGSVSGAGNTLENVKTFSVGVTGNVKVSTDKRVDPLPKPDQDPIVDPSVPNKGDEKIGQFKCTVNLTAEDGRKYNTTATANVTSVKATGTGKKISGYFRLKDMDTQEELHVPFDGTLEKGLF